MVIVRNEPKLLCHAFGVREGYEQIAAQSMLKAGEDRRHGIVAVLCA